MRKASTMRPFHIALGVAGLVIVSCGANPASNQAAAPAPSQGADKSGAPPAAGSQASSEGKPTLESQREPFMKACQAKAGGREYCECGFEQFREVFKDADLSKPMAESDPRMQTLGEKTAGACASKLSEEQIKTNFTNACIANDNRRRAYCTCAWPALRKNLEPAEFVTPDTKGLRFVAAKKVMVVACKGKFPVEVARADFMKGCSKDDPSKEAVCTCLWKKVKARATTEELAAGTIDVAAIPGLAECNKSAGAAGSP